MAGQQGPFKKSTTDLLNDMLDFGPEISAPSTQDVQERIKQVLKKLQELNRRMDRLAAK